MAIKSKSKVLAAKIEGVFNVEEVLTDAESLEVKSNSSLEVSLETKDRDVIRNSLLKLAPIPIREEASGTIAVELMASGTDDNLIGDVLLEAGLGVKSVAGTAGGGTGAFIGFSDDGTTVANEIFMATVSDTADSTAVAYTLAGTDATTKSLTIKEFIGIDKSVVTTGNVVESIKFNLPTADIATLDFSVGGCGFETSNSDTKLNPLCVDGIPYLGKSATYVFDGTSLDATDVSIDITNEVYNVEAVTADGYSAKIITGQEVKGSFKVLFEDYALLTKFQNNVDGSLYIMLTSGTSKFAVYVPKLKLTSFSKSDDSGVISQSVEFVVVTSCVAGQEPIIFASEVA